MKVVVSWEFEVDVSDLDPKFIDVPGIAKELTKAELACLLKSGDMTVNDFEYAVVV